MLFDPAPKETRKELFNRERELEELRSCIRNGKIAIVLGVRRIGKTSLLKVFAGESGFPYVFIDARKLSEYGYSKMSLYKILSEEFSKRKRGLEKIADYLKKIRGVGIFETHLEFDWREKGLSVSSIFEKLEEYAEDNDTSFLIIVDEAQEMRYLRGHGKMDFRKIIAYSYDNLRRVKFVLSGSEVGILNEFLGFGDSESPLYGRAREVINVERFSKEKSLEFLEAGFSEVGMSVSMEEIEKAVEILDGIPGWLTLYGYMAVRKNNIKVLDQVVDEAVKIAAKELSNLIKGSRLYEHVLKAMAMGYRNWKNIGYFVESRLGRPVYDKSLYEILQKLIAASIIEKRGTEYDFLDPIYREASKRL
ncbi:MAG: ATP-binding protein [Archaeoglobaceae archaeon]